MTEEKREELTCWICKRLFFGVEPLSNEEAKDIREFLQEVLRDNYVKQKEDIGNFSLCPICVWFIEGGIETALVEKASESIEALSRVRGLNSGTAIG